MDDRLIKTLEKMTIQERWVKKARHKGEIIKKKLTKKGNILFVIKKPTYDVNVVVPQNRKNVVVPQNRKNVVVPQNRKKEFELAQNLKVGEVISIIGEKKVNLIICDRLKRINKDLKFHSLFIKAILFFLINGFLWMNCS